MTRFPHKRAALARGLRASGLLRLLERAARRPCLAVLTYHRVADPGRTPFYGPVCSATPETLAAQLRHLRDRYHVARLDEVVRLAEGGFRLTRPTALVTFDDGYRDNHEAALPVLRALGLSATFFLPTAFYREPRLPWWDHVAHTLKATERTALALDWPEPVALDLTGPSRDGAIRTLIGLFRRHHLTGADEARFLAELDDRAGVAVDSPGLGRALFLSRDQALDLAGAGMSLGSHAHTHRELARLPEAEQRAELADSKRILEADLGREVTALAYPYGWPGACDATTERLAREVGYRVAFASVEGLNLPGATDPFAVRRLNVGFADGPTLLRARLALHAHFGRSAV